MSAGKQYPNALCMSEHVHVLFSALQHGVEKTLDMQHWSKKVNVLERLLSDRLLK